MCTRSDYWFGVFYKNQIKFDITIAIRCGAGGDICTTGGIRLGTEQDNRYEGTAGRDALLFFT